MRYRKKPVEIEARQLQESSIESILLFMGEELIFDQLHATGKMEEYKQDVLKNGMKIETIEGTMNAQIGDFIIKGVKGEFYPCKPDIFEMTYKKFNVIKYAFY